MMVKKIFIYWMIFINIITFFIYGLDKLKAIKKGRRISEMCLLNLSLIGGSLGGFISMYLFHHKTRKHIFVVGNILLIIIHTFIYLYFIK